MTLETSNARPMLGTLTADRWGKTWMRHDKPANAEYRRLQVRLARRHEARMIAADLAAERAERIEIAEPDEIHNDWASELADVNRDADLFYDLTPACYCRRCFLHDDPGGCLLARERHEAERAVLDDLADEVMLAQHDLGYGDTFDPDEIQWGFRVTDAHKAPGVTSGRPRPTALTDTYVP